MIVFNNFYCRRVNDLSDAINKEIRTLLKDTVVFADLPCLVYALDCICRKHNRQFIRMRPFSAVAHRNPLFKNRISISISTSSTGTRACLNIDCMEIHTCLYWNENSKFLSSDVPAEVIIEDLNLPF